MSRFFFLFCMRILKICISEWNWWHFLHRKLLLTWSGCSADSKNFTSFNTPREEKQCTPQSQASNWKSFTFFFSFLQNIKNYENCKTIIPRSTLKKKWHENKRIRNLLFVFPALQRKCLEIGYGHFWGRAWFPMVREVKLGVPKLSGFFRLFSSPEG